MKPDEAMEIIQALLVEAEKLRHAEELNQDEKLKNPETGHHNWQWIVHEHPNSN